VDEIIKRRGNSIPTKRPFSVEIKKSIYMLIFTLLAIIVMVSIVYLLNSSQTNQKGYSLEEAQLQKDTLTEESNKLVSKIIQAESSKSIEGSDQVKQMVPPDNTVYFDPGTNTFTKKK
jgi:hypothetical protein